jgi:hypothetical protein
VSGESGGPYSVGGAPGGGLGPLPTQTDCSQVFERLTLTSPVPTVLEGLQVNQVLALERPGGTGPLLAVTSDGDIAGSVTGTILTQIFPCMEQGFRFVAVVVSITGGKCLVEVRPE